MSWIENCLQTCCLSLAGVDVEVFLDDSGRVKEQKLTILKTKKDLMRTRRHHLPLQNAIQEE